MMSQNSVSLDTELRKLRPAELYTLGQILNISDAWKKLMSIVPKNDTSDLPKFNADHFSMIEQAAQQQKRNAAEIFLAEWGTMGRHRPTLQKVLKLLVQAELFRAADYVAGDILKEELPKRPECGPAAPVDTSDELIEKLLEDKAGLQNTDFNESLIFGLPSVVNDNEMICPILMDNVMNNNSLHRNLQSTKLISSKSDHKKMCLKNVENTNIYEKRAQALNINGSDLMKFSSSNHNMQEHSIINASNLRNNRAEQFFDKQEIPSEELPIFVNEFRKTTDQTTQQLHEEVLSSEFPTFLNSSITTSDNSSSNKSTDSSLNLSNTNINQNEIDSTELPQCIVEFHLKPETNLNKSSIIKNNDNTMENILNSQELPITVLKYNI